MTVDLIDQCAVQGTTRCENVIRSVALQLHTTAVRENKSDVTPASPDRTSPTPSPPPTAPPRLPKRLFEY